MKFNFDRSKMPEVVFEGQREFNGEMFDNYQVGTWHFSLAHQGDKSVKYSEDTIYAFAAWIEFLYENDLNID